MPGLTHIPLHACATAHTAKMTSLKAHVRTYWKRAFLFMYAQLRLHSPITYNLPCLMCLCAIAHPYLHISAQTTSLCSFTPLPHCQRHPGKHMGSDSRTFDSLVISQHPRRAASHRWPQPPLQRTTRRTTVQPEGHEERRHPFLP